MFNLSLMTGKFPDAPGKVPKEMGIVVRDVEGFTIYSCTPGNSRFRQQSFS
jgi:hypothetical protein